MPLILAIEPDRRQASQLTAMVRGRLHAELVLGESAERALAALGQRVPDLILTSALLSPKDENALGERLRALDGAAAQRTDAHDPRARVGVRPRRQPRGRRALRTATRQRQGRDGARRVRPGSICGAVQGIPRARGNRTGRAGGAGGHGRARRPGRNVRQTRRCRGERRQAGVGSRIEESQGGRASIDRAAAA